MKKNLIIGLITVVFVGACTVTLFYNKKKIDEKARLDGNLKSIPVFVEQVAKESLSGYFEVQGDFEPIHELTLQSEGQGKVTALRFSTGDIVKAGQVLAELDNEVVRSQLSLAEAALEKARNDQFKFESLLKEDAVSSQQVEESRLALKKAETDVATLRKQLDFTLIETPIAGTVTRRFIEKGSLLSPGAPVAEIVDISRLKFIARVAEAEAVQIGRGDRVELVSSLFPGNMFPGTVVSVGVKADDARRFPVEIEVVNKPGFPLKAGMFGTARFRFGVDREVILIPRHALVGSIKEPKVYVVEQDKAVLKDIRTGTATDHDIEVTAGLQPGEWIVTSGQINLDPDTPVSVVQNK
jgi:RND family efflux transporter MFP subunit